MQDYVVMNFFFFFGFFLNLCFMYMFQQIQKHARLQLSDSLDDSPNVLVFQVNRPCTLCNTHLTFLIFTSLILLLTHTHNHSPTTLENIFPYGFTSYVLLNFLFVLQIIGGFPFTTDIVLISGTDLETSREEERVSMLTGFHRLLYNVCTKSGMYVCVLSSKRRKKSSPLHCCRSCRLAH